MSTRREGRTTLGVSRDLKRRIDQQKPYETMSYEEFLEELVDHYEEQ